MFLSTAIKLKKKSSCQEVIIAHKDNGTRKTSAKRIFHHSILLNLND